MPRMGTFDLILRGGTCVTTRGTRVADVGIRGGEVAEIGDLGQSDGDQVFDATGLHVLPGCIDPQVHFREPGFEHKEDLETGTRAAVLGRIHPQCVTPTHQSERNAQGRAAASPPPLAAAAAATWRVTSGRVRSAYTTHTLAHTIFV